MAVHGALVLLVARRNNEEVWMKDRGFMIVGVAVAAWFLAGVETGFAAPNAWQTTAGNWETAGNWSDGVPDGSDAISITNNSASATLGNGAADFDLGMNATSITVGANSGLAAMTVNFTNSMKTQYVGGASSGNITIGEKTAGKVGLLTVNNGNIDTYKLVVGQGAGTSGRLVINGGRINVRSGDWPLPGFSVGESVEGQIGNSTGTVIMTGGELYLPDTAPYAVIGSWGKGTMIISNGVFSARYVEVGYVGQGELKIYGGTNLVRSQMLIPSHSAGRGTVLVDGGTLDAPVASVSYVYLNNGTLTVSNGFANLTALSMGNTPGKYAEFNVAGGTSTLFYANQRGRIGVVAGATGVVNVTGGLLNCLDVQIIGVAGRGTLNVSGGLSKNAYTWIGYQAGGFGNLNITGGTYKNDPNFCEIHRGAILVNGGVFTNPGTTMVIGKLAGQTGTVTVASGTFSVPNCTTTVGNPGVGMLEVQGKNSTIALKALTADTANSTVKFTLGATGVSPIAVANALTVTSDTKLVVNVSNYDTANGYTVDLITYGTMPTPFAAITITGGHGGETITQTGSKVTLNVPKPYGTIYSVM